jgi:hypothetical protein
VNGMRLEGIDPLAVNAVLWARKNCLGMHRNMDIIVWPPFQGVAFGSKQPTDKSRPF